MLILVFSDIRKYLQMCLLWNGRTRQLGELRGRVPPPLRVKPVTRTVVFILEDRTAAGSMQVETASRTRNHKPDRTQREADSQGPETKTAQRKQRV